jgi:hypothetical protein
VIRPLLLLLLLLPACAAPRPAGPADLPDDFSLGLTTLPAKGVTDPALAPAWYILQPDDSLRIALGARQVTSPLPPIVRILSRAQVRTVWEQVVQSGFASELQAHQLPDTMASVQSSIALVYIAAQGRRRSFSIPLDDESGTKAASDLAATLRELGWVLAPPTPANAPTLMPEEPIQPQAPIEPIPMQDPEQTGSPS